MLVDVKKKSDPEGFSPNVDTQDYAAKSSTSAVVWLVVLIIIPGCIIFGLLTWIIWRMKIHNEFNRQQIKINETASGIDVQLTKRRDTLIKLLQTTKGYMDHESSLLKEITKYRNVNINANNRQEIDQATTSSLGRLLATVENYPNLKADEQFNQLMSSIDYIEREIASSRRLYNANVSAFNQQLFVWPKNIIAAKMNLHTIPMFAASEQQKQDVEIKF